MFRARKCFIMIIMALILFACVTACKSKAEDTEYMQEIHTNYSEGNFETALQLSEALPEPFNRYYSDFIHKRIELDNWSGTEDELYTWMEDTFSLFDFDSMALPDETSYYSLYSGGEAAEQEFEENKAWIADSLRWAEEFSTEKKSFVDQYTSICEQTADLLLSQDGSDRVYIYKENVDRLDSMMYSLFDYTTSIINDLIPRYGIGDESREKIITPFLNNMESMVYDYYSDGISLNHIFDLSTIDKLGSVSLETAESDREYIENTLTLALIDPTIYGRNALAANAELPIEGRPDVSVPDSVVECASDGGFKLFIILNTVFPGNTATLLFSEDHATSVNAPDGQVISATDDWMSQYSYVVDCGSGLFCVEQDGYYGCLDANGNKVIGVYYEEPLFFENGVSIVRSNGKYGVVDKQGNELIAPMYREIQLNGGYIQVSDYTDSWGLCSLSGELLVPTGYLGFEYLSSSILACTSHGQEKYDLYDLSGNPFSAENVTALTGYVCNTVESVSVLADDRLWVRCKITENAQYSILLDTNMALVTTRCFSSAYIPPFNALGYSIATPCHIDSRPDFGGTSYFCIGEGSYVIDKSGNLITDLPTLQLGYAYNSYEDANQYYAYGRGATGTGLYTYRQAIVNLRTKEITEYASIEMINGTNCIIVSDSATNRYGLYDGEELALDIVYDSIQYQSDGSILAQRGAEMTTYMPQ